jgi:hypothetical protein
VFKVVQSVDLGMLSATLRCFDDEMENYSSQFASHEKTYIKDVCDKLIMTCLLCSVVVEIGKCSSRAHWAQQKSDTSRQAV